MTDNEQINQILEKYRAGDSLTEQEHAFLDNWYLDKAEASQSTPIDQSQLEEDLRQIKSQLPGMNAGRKLYRKVLGWSSVAACFFGILGYIYLTNDFQKQTLVASKVASVRQTPEDKLPGGNKATLQIEGQQTLTLDSSLNTDAARLARAGVGQREKGELAMLAVEKDEIVFNTLSTPKGGEYRLLLADGTKVWLNASSSVRFPSAFTGNERTVEVTGEVYFEVAKNASMPFKVKHKDQLVEVLGTHFNINAYPENSTVRTTLLEGSVKVTQTNGTEQKVLRPGQQSDLRAAAKGIAVSTANTEQVMAWKNGFFYFDDQPIENIMKQLANWYDIDVVYSEGSKGKKFGGMISRDKTLSQVLKVLQYTGDVEFKIQQDKVYVL